MTTRFHDNLSDQLEGYGDDRDKYLGAFPFDRQMGENAEFRKQLDNMGGCVYI